MGEFLGKYLILLNCHPGSKYIAIGLMVNYELGWPQLQYPDNTPVPDTLVGTAFEWKDASYPKNDNVSKCVAFDEDKNVVNMECNITGEWELKRNPGGRGRVHFEKWRARCKLECERIFTAFI